MVYRVHLERKEILAHLDQLDPEVLQGQEETRVILDLWVSPVKKVLLETLEILVCRALKV